MGYCFCFNFFFSQKPTESWVVWVCTIQNVEILLFDICWWVVYTVLQAQCYTDELVDAKTYGGSSQIVHSTLRSVCNNSSERKTHFKKKTFLQENGFSRFTFICIPHKPLQFSHFLPYLLLYWKIYDDFRKFYDTIWFSHYYIIPHIYISPY